MDAFSRQALINLVGHSEHLCFPRKRFLKKSCAHVSKLVRPWRQDKFGDVRKRLVGLDGGLMDRSVVYVVSCEGQW